MESIWASIKSDWQGQALCKEADEDFVPDVETDAGLERIQRSHCNQCPVRQKCLNSALINGDRGYWGGTSSVQRTALKRVRNRAKCPVCLSRGVIRAESYEVCLNCGASWQAESRPVQKAPEIRIVRNPSVTPVEDVSLPEGEAACL